MITILHGNHIGASRDELHRLLERAAGGEVRRLDGKSLDAGVLTQALESSSLFGGNVTVVIERLFGSMGRQTKQAETFTRVILAAADVNVILWEDKELTTAILKHFGSGGVVRLFKLPTVIFSFLDSLKPGNKATLITSFRLVFEVEAAELVFALMVNRVRTMIVIASGETPKDLAPWQVTRLTTQAKSFTMGELITLYGKLADAEYAVKSGASAFSLKEHIELILTEL